MANPTSTNRTTPTGIPFHDGHPVKVAFALDPDINFWEKATKPPGLDNGDAINTTTAHNSRWRTFAMRDLITLTPITIRVAYDDSVYDQIVSIMGINGSVTVHLPDGAKIDFFGGLQKFEPQDMSEEGGQPEADITIQPTNYDPVNHLEVGPVVTEVAGT